MALLVLISCLGLSSSVQAQQNRDTLQPDGRLIFNGGCEQQLYYCSYCRGNYPTAHVHQQSQPYGGGYYGNQRRSWVDVLGVILSGGVKINSENVRVEVPQPQTQNPAVNQQNQDLLRENAELKDAFERAAKIAAALARHQNDLANQQHNSQIKTKKISVYNATKGRAQINGQLHGVPIEGMVQIAPNRRVLIEIDEDSYWTPVLLTSMGLLDLESEDKGPNTYQLIMPAKWQAQFDKLSPEQQKAMLGE